MKKLQEKPLSINSPSVHPANDASATSAPSKFHLSRYHAICFCGFCISIIAILGLVILILSFTLLKVRDPTLTLKSIKVDNFRINTSMTPANFVSANLTLVSVISIENPNVATFNFDRTVTKFYYHKDTLGVAYAPAGRLGARKATRLNVIVDVLADQIIKDNNITANILLQREISLTSYTGVKGRVSVFGLYKKNMEVGLKCNIVLGVSILAEEIKSTSCLASDLKE